MVKRVFIYSEVKMKRIVSLMLTVCMVFGLCSCGAVQNTINTVNGASGNSAGKPAAASKTGHVLSTLKLPEGADLPDPSEYVKKDGSVDWDKMQKVDEAWQAYYDKRGELQASYSGKLDEYMKRAVVFLQGEEGKNKVCSPVNIFFALAILAEVTGSSTRAQILDALGINSIEELRAVSKAVWESNYAKSKDYTLTLGASLWQNDKVEYNEQTIADLAMYYYTTAYSGDPTEPDFTMAFKNWLDENTGGMLKDQISMVPDFDKHLILAIATTIYFKGSWENEFNEGATDKQTFHGVKTEFETDTMHTMSSMAYYEGDGFKAVMLPFKSGNAMWILLPDEGKTPEELYADGTFMDFINGDAVDSQDLRYCQVKLSLPKFDINSYLNIIPMLESLGITEVFYPGADFTPLTNTDGVYVSDAIHSARVKIDEEGCEAAAFTVIITKDGAVFFDTVIEFNVDRPFGFVLTASDGLPLFTGIVNDPR